MTLGEHSKSLKLGRRAVASLVAVMSSVVWVHVAAALMDLPASSAALLTSAALVAGLAGSLMRSATHAALSAAVVGALAVALASFAGPSWFGLVAVVLPSAGVAALRPRLERMLPSWPSNQGVRHPLAVAAWTLLALLAVVQVGRLATFMTDRESDWFLSTRHPFYAKHECLSAYIYGAELDQRGEANIYDATLYPGLNPQAKPHTRYAGMTPEDPYQYPPPFLLLPRLALELTSDYQAMRMVWFGLNFTLCIGAFLTLATWIGGASGAWTMLGLPFLMASFPVLHNLQYGQFHFAAIALAVLALVAFASRRDALGGTLLAVAIVSKLFPVFLLPVLAAQRRWRALVFTAFAGAAIVALTWVSLGAQPFIAFFDYQLPRLSSGQAFAFGEAWPDLAMLVTAGNQGVQGVIQKLAMMGMPGAGAQIAQVASSIYAVALLLVSAGVGALIAAGSRVGHAAAWLGLLGLASLGSAGAWADYVPVSAIWALTLIAPLVSQRPRSRLLVPALVIAALLQFSLLGTMPLGEFAAASWMLPLSLLSALSLFGVSGGSIVLGVQTSTSPIGSLLERRDSLGLALRA